MKTQTGSDLTDVQGLFSVELSPFSANKKRIIQMDQRHHCHLPS